MKDDRYKNLVPMTRVRSKSTYHTTLPDGSGGANGSVSIQPGEVWRIVNYDPEMECVYIQNPERKLGAALNAELFRLCWEVVDNDN